MSDDVSARARETVVLATVEVIASVVPASNIFLRSGCAFVVMVRPMSGMHALAEAMKAQLTDV